MLAPDSSGRESGAQLGWFNGFGCSAGISARHGVIVRQRGARELYSKSERGANGYVAGRDLLFAVVS
jgi:hypothetical protein